TSSASDAATNFRERFLPIKPYLDFFALGGLSDAFVACLRFFSYSLAGADVCVGCADVTGVETAGLGGALDAVDLGFLAGLVGFDTMAVVNINSPAGQAPAMASPRFWDTVQYDKTAGCYRCQLDEQWFVLTKETLMEALQITPVNNNQTFISPPSSDVLINFANELGYAKLVRNLSNVITNDMFQPWRALTTIINMCLTGKTSGFKRPRAPVLQILWGVITRAHIDYTERIWEEFTQSIYTFIDDKWNLTQHTSGKNNATLIMIPKPVLGYLKFSAMGTKREVFGLPIPGSLITADIQEASYYQEYLENVAKHRRYLAGETGSDPDSPAPKPTKLARKPKSTAPKAPPRPSPSKAEKSKYGFVSKKRTLKSMAESVAEDVPAKEPHVYAEDADMHKALEESLKSMYDVPRGPLPPVVIREPESGKYQPLPKVPRKGEEKVTEEQVTHDLLSLQKPKKKSPSDQYIFQRRTSTPTGSSGHDESSYAELGLSYSEEESKKVMPGADAGGQSEGQARPDPGAQAEGQTGLDASAQDKGQAGSNPDEQFEGQAGPDSGNAGADKQPMSSHVVHAGSDHEHMDFYVADVSPQHSTEQMDEGFTATDKPSKGDNDKANAETEVESMVSITIQQDMSSIPPMTSPIIDLTSRPESPKVHQQLKAIAIETITTITTTLPPPPYQQQSTAGAMMMKCIDELEHIMANLIQENNRDLPEAGMKEILHQRMWETESYKSHKDHMQLCEALEKLMNRDHSEELVQDLAEARKKNKKSRESPKTPLGSPPYQPPPPLQPAGPSGASGAPGASRSS
nr:monodehydroascorbate reductase [Tanacetum cinerariifolium]